MPNSHLVLLAQDSDWSLQLWRSALRSQGLAVIVVPHGQPLREYLATLDQKYPMRLLVLDLKVLKREAVSLASFAPWFAQACPAIELALTTDAKFEINPSEQAWATKHGAACLLPALSPHLAEVTASRVMAPLLSLLGITKVADRDLHRMLLALSALTPEHQNERAGAYAHGQRLRATGEDLAQLARQLHAGVERTQRRHLGKSYANCLVGSEACTWLARRRHCSREEAGDLGRALLACGYLHHVTKQQPFLDGNYFYRCVEDPASIDTIDLDQVVADIAIAPGLIATRSYHGRSFTDCCVGHELVDWLCHHRSLTREQAVHLGQRLLDLSIMHHVVDEHDFVDDYLFYSFCAA